MLIIQAEHVVYHYTNQKGLLGILQSNSLWASHVFYQNDSKEFLYGKELFYSYIKEFFPQRFLNFHIGLIDEIEKWINFFNNPIFTISFSEERTSLNQFRTYAKSRSGFSIGFNIDNLINTLHEKKFQNKFVKCIYTKKEQHEFISEMINKCITEKGIRKYLDDDFLSFIAARIISYSPILKHESFSEEKEWRLIFDYLNPIRDSYRFRPGESFVIPYLEVPINPIDAIHEILIGPTPYSELAVLSTKEVATKYGLFDEELDERIHYSELPYRDW